MATKSQEIKEIQELRHKITDLSQHLSEEQSIITLMQKNPSYAVILALILVFFGAMTTRKIIKAFMKFSSISLKVTAVLFVLQKGITALSKLKRFTK